MKKKILSIFITIFALCTCMFTLTACGHEHSYTTSVTAPTCIEQGYTTYICSCGDSYIDDYVNALGHDFADYTYNNDATCTGNGTETATCARDNCGETDTRTKDNSTLNHDYDTPTYIWNNDKCTATRVCSRDNTHIETETATAVYVKDTDATCFVAEKGHYKATFNNNAFEIQETEEESVVNGEPLNHSFNNPFYVWNDNQCTATRVCAHDDTHIETETVTGIYVKDTDVTCTTAEKGHYEAAFTNSVFTAQVTAINSVENGKELGHSFTNYAYNEDAKCGIDGTETAVCDHNCGESDTKTKAGSALQHDYAQAQYAWNGNQCIAIRVCNRDNTHIETETATGTYVKDTDATCTTPEKGHYEATFVNSNFSSQSTTSNSVINGEALGHSYASKWESNATHHWHKANCEHTSEISEKIEHDFGTDNICDTCEYIRGIAVSGITLNYTSFAVMIGEVKTLIATITPDDATNKNVMWTTSNSSVITVDENGVVTAVGAGNAIVYAVTEDGAKMAQCIVVVIANECSHITTRTERENEVDSTCKEVGSYDEVVYCSVCGNELSRIQKIIAKKETHTPVTDARVEPTFTETGLTEGSHCGVCGYVIVAQELIPVKPSKAEISSEALTVNGTNISGKFSYATTEFNFANDISVTNSDTWVLSSDANGEYTIITKKATLTEGDNILYIHVENPDRTVTTYTINIYRNHMYTVSFDTDGGTSVETQYVEEGCFATEPITTRTGYTFNSWDYDFASPIIANTTITATWSANTNTKYVVEYYLQNLKNDDYTIDNTRSYQTVGTTDNTATITPENIEHFTLNQDLSVLSGNIDGKGDLVLKVYYTRNSYSITTNRNNTKAGTITSGGAYKFDKQITVTATTNDGYTFLGWYNDETKVYNELSYTFNVCETITLTAKWSTNVYNIEYELNGGENNKNNVATYTIETATFALKTPTKTGYNFNGWFTEETFKNQVTEITLGSFGDVKVYAKWTPTNYTVTYNYGYAEKVTTDTYNIETPTFDLIIPTRDGYTFDGWYLEETFKNQVTKVGIGSYGDKVYYAKWSANTDTKYTVIYYLQNIDDDNYTPYETLELEGETDTTVYGETERYTHFTYNATKGMLSGNINGDGSQVLSVYYTRDSYKIIANNNNAKAGTSTQVNGNYRYNKEFTLKATTNAGYTFLGWYEGTKLVCESEEFTFNAEKKVTYTATWSANTDTKYTVIYYLQNIDDDNYTPHETVVLEGETDTMAYGETERYAHFTYNASTGLVSGNINGDGSQVLNVYYTRNTYTISVEGSSYGEVTNTGIYKFGEEVSSTASIKLLGYELVGWYSGDELLSTELSYTFTVNKNVTAKFALIAEMSNFNFTSTKTTCNISGIKNTYVTKIIIPDCVTSISSSAFSGCRNLTEITIPFVGKQAGVTENDTYQYPFGYIFGTSNYSGSRRTTQYYYGSSTSSTTSTAYYIPTSLKKVTITGGNILRGAFSDCYYLTSIEILDSVTSIGDEAFVACVNLTSIEIPDSVTSIGVCAFAGCDSLTSVAIPNSVTSIGIGAFEDCDSLTSVAIPNSVTSIGRATFKNCDSLTSVVIPDSVTSICDAMFSNCCRLRSIEIPNSITSIGDEAFYGCDSLTSIVIPSSVTSIGYRAFYDCDGFTSVEIPDSVTTIGNGAFSWCYGLTSVEIPDSVTSIGSDVFAYCVGLTSVEIPASVTSIGSDAFAYCGSLTIVEIPDSVISIGSDAFASCSGLTSVEIPDSVMSIGSYAFAHCGSLISVEIGDSVTTIGSDAFYGCVKLCKVVNRSNLTLTLGSSDNGGIATYAKILVEKNGNKIYKQETGIEYFETVDQFLFKKDNEGYTLIAYLGKEKTVTLPENANGNTYEIYQMSGIRNVIIPDGATTIDDYAFYNCTSLTSVYYKGTVEGWAEVTVGEDNDSLTVETCYYYSESEHTTLGNYWHYNEDGEIEIWQHNFVNYICTICGLESYTEGLSFELINNNTEYSVIGYNGTALEVYIPSIYNNKPVTRIGDNSFLDCLITSIVIPESITSIGSSAFGGCSSLTKVNYLGSIDNWVMISVESYHSNPLLYAKNLYINNELATHVKLTTATKISVGVFQCCISLESIEISSSIVSIEGGAFYGCTRLTRVYYKGTVEDWSKISIASSDNGCLTNATRYYYSENEPTTTGNYWHYDENGNPVVW